MGTQYETITITTSGANAGNPITVTVPVDTTTGSGSATFTYTGVNGGTDLLVASGNLASTPYTSNSAQVNWQASNGQIQLADVVTCYSWNDSPQSGAVASYGWKNPSDTGSNGSPRGIGDSQATSQNNSIAFDTFDSGPGGGGNGIGSGQGAPIWYTLNAAGQPVGQPRFPPYNQNFNAIIIGSILVPAPGNYSLTLNYKDGSLWGIGNSTTGAVPTWSGQGSIRGISNQSMTVNGGFPLLSSPGLSSGSSGYVGTATNVVTFPSAGVYPIEVNWDYWYHAGRILHVTSGSGELTPVTITAAPPASSPTGNLTITPAGGATNLQVVGQAITLTVNVAGIAYPTKSYCPVFEGTNGSLFIYNDPNNPNFNFPTYNGYAVNKTAAASAVFALASLDNGAYQGLFSVGYDGTNFTLNYNGGTANPNPNSRVLSTSLLVKADDVAWFNSANNSFDTFTVSGTTGGTTFNFEVDYMNKPAVASFSPTTIQANGSAQTLSISLTKAFSPQQQGAKNTGNSVSAACSILGASAGTPVPVLDAQGWLTGWNVPFTAPVATTNQTLTVQLLVNGTLTYLSGSSFVTTAVTYITGNIGTITASGTSFFPPTVIGLAALPAGPAYSSFVTAVTLSATIFTVGGNDPLNVSFYYQPVGQGSNNVIGSGAFLNSQPATVNGQSGYQQTYQVTFNPNLYLDPAPGDYLGFVAVDTVSGLSCQYTTTTAYYAISSGGNSGGGCPAIEMFVKEGLQVKDVVVGDDLDAIEDYHDPGVSLPVQWMDFTDEESIRFETENGAVVIVSESTPVPTLETWEALLAGEEPSSLPQLANAIKSGMHVLTNIDGQIEFSMLVETARIGIRKVARLYIGGKNFAAGEDPTKRIYTHNGGVSVK
jgi:hypothetical protein